MPNFRRPKKNEIDPYVDRAFFIFAASPAIVFYRSPLSVEHLALADAVLETASKT
jgi:hypothetical protein